MAFPHQKPTRTWDKKNNATSPLGWRKNASCLIIQNHDLLMFSGMKDDFECEELQIPFYHYTTGMNWQGMQIIHCYSQCQSKQHHSAESDVKEICLLVAKEPQETNMIATERPRNHRTVCFLLTPCRDPFRPNTGQKTISLQTLHAMWWWLTDTQ